MRRFSIPLIASAILILLLTGLALAKTPKTKPGPTLLPVEPPTVTAGPTVTPSPTPAPTSTPTSTPTTTPTPSTTPTPTATPIPPTPTSSPTPTPPINIPSYPPNEMGDVLVLVYHAIGRPEGRWQRTPENLRGDLEYLIARGYYPVNLIDYATGNLDDVPRGRRPIVLTFDDSSRGHFRYLEDGAIGDASIDPDCAVGILVEMHAQYGDYWPLHATFYVLLSSGEEPGARLFRQADLAAQKVRAIVDMGIEVGSHTITHPDLSQITPAEVQWELAVSQNRIEALIPGYEVRSLALPFGDYPSDVSLLRESHADLVDLDYRYDAAVRLGARPAPSPFSPEFNPFYIPRVQAIQSQLDYWLAYYEKHPELYYVSDGGDESDGVSHHKSEGEP